MRTVVDGFVIVEAAGFTVTLKDGISYSANHMTTAFDSVYREPTLTFVCSGVVKTVKASDVASVEFLMGVQHCNDCDQRYPFGIVPDEGEQVQVLR